MFAIIRNGLMKIINGNLQKAESLGVTNMIHVRNATKKAGGQARKQGKNRKGKRRGAKKFDGCHVKSGQILVRQLGFKFHPGKNVGYARDHTLYALCEGYVKYTRELMGPLPFKLARHPKGYVERRFVNVLERPKPRKLICINESDDKRTLDTVKNIV